ncbi:MAG: hypothetical protein A3E79_12320 [Burkholderiales bacterium RIFCSPHIGHO2_12_FULL_61_11]|nr:MAG: hypothetical protein A3E79_12320 [Burkholderiales bacterium RIFCSPHIGHO2_12_FULL_61_11]
MDMVETKLKEVLAHYGYTYDKSGADLLPKVVADAQELTQPSLEGSVGFDVDALHVLNLMIQHLLYKHRL